MPTWKPAPRLSLRLLSDAQHRLAALQIFPLDAAGVEPSSYPHLAAVCALLPCLIEPHDAQRLAPPALDALLASGCAVARAGAIGILDTSGAPPQPPGASYLGGNWYLQPPSTPSAHQTGSRALALKLAQMIASDAETREIEEVFRHEPTLAYSLLRLVNSAAIGNGRRIDNFAQAILLLGRRQLRRWLNLILFSSQKEDARSAMLLARVALRARTLEQLAKAAGYDKEAQERAFMVGMFSLLGVLFGMPLQAVLQPLKLDPELSRALLLRQGEIGRLLTAVEALECGDPTQALALMEAMQAEPVDLDVLSIDAHVWMLGLISDSADGVCG